MWKYIITWCVLIVIQDPSTTIIKEDEFGRKSYQHCMDFKFHYECENHFKEFINRDSAFAFWGRIKKEQSKSFMVYDRVDSVKIDSVFLDVDIDINVR